MEYLELQKQFSKFVGVNGCVAVSTGTAALHVALAALKLPPKSEVIVPQFTMIATAWAVHYCGYTPVFVDCDDHLLIDIDRIEKKITSNTKVIMVTHVYGRVVNMDRVMKLAAKYNLRVIEDAAEAHGCNWNDKSVGSFDIGCFSFYRNKIVCGEEGGAVVSNDLEFLSIVNDMKSMSFGKHHNYMHEQIGFNYRMTNCQASLILDSLSNVKENIKKRRQNQQIYDSILPSHYHMPTRDVPWVYDLKVNDNTVVDRLRKQGIQARYGFKPVSTCAPFFKKIELNKSLEMSKTVIYLPVDPTLSEEKIVEIASTFRRLE